MISGLLAVAAAAALGTALAIRLLRPVLVRYALARPNARSSHVVPTPQGGGIAILIAAALAAAGGFAFAGVPVEPGILVLGSGALGLALLGGIDDVRPLPAGLRLLVQLACVAALAAVPRQLGILPVGFPVWLEGALVCLAGLWWVNLVNFMDGIDWMSVAESVPLAFGICAFGVAGFLPLPITIVAAALLGGMLGFAPSNRPVARLFLGDVGSLPLGFVTGWLLLALAERGGLAAALLLPMYYVADATLTLLRRLRRGARIWEAHREHAYQRALGRGFRVIEVDARVFGLNVVLLCLATVTLLWPVLPIQAAALATGACLTAFLLQRFERGRSI